MVKVIRLLKVVKLQANSRVSTLILCAALSQCFFFPVNIESARERHFFSKFHGHFFAFTGTFWECSRATECVHGHFFGRFHGHFWGVHGQKYRKCSRALFEVHGHILMNFEINFLMFTGTFQCSRALLMTTNCNEGPQKINVIWHWVQIFNTRVYKKLNQNHNSVNTGRVARVNKK